jgi:hypothetical protein
MVSMEEEIINVFFVIDEKLKVFHHESHYHSKLSDSEVITLSIIKELWKTYSDKDFFRLIKEKFSNLFPYLCDYSQYMKRVKSLSYIIFRLIEEYSFNTQDDLFIIDTKPIPLVSNSRAYRTVTPKVFELWRIKPAWGRCAAKKETYFGFKLVALWNKGKIVCFSLVSANTSEQECLMILVRTNNLRNMKIFGDKGFILNVTDKTELAKYNIIVEAIPRKNMKVIIENIGFKKYKRKGIETCFSVLKLSFFIENIAVRSIIGFTTSITRKVLAYNLRHLHYQNI